MACCHTDCYDTEGFKGFEYEDEDDYAYEEEEEGESIYQPLVLEAHGVLGPHTFEGRLAKDRVICTGSFSQEMTLYLGTLWGIALSADPYSAFRERMTHLEPPPSEIEKDFELGIARPYVYEAKDEAFFQALKNQVVVHVEDKAETDKGRAFFNAHTLALETLFTRCFVCCRALAKPESPYHCDSGLVREWPRFCMSHFCTFQLQLAAYVSHDPTISFAQPFFDAMKHKSKDSKIGKYLEGKYGDFKNSLSLFLPVRLSPVESVHALPLALPAGSYPRQMFQVCDNLSAKALAWSPCSDSTDEVAYFFHGTPKENVLSILTCGLISLSSTCLMRKGKAHGDGIYLSPQLATSRQYGAQVFICAVWGAQRKTDDIYTVDQGSKVLITHLLVF